MLLKILRLVSESTLVSTDKFAETFTKHTRSHTRTHSLTDVFWHCTLELLKRRAGTLCSTPCMVSTHSYPRWPDCGWGRFLARRVMGFTTFTGTRMRSAGSSWGHSCMRRTNCKVTNCKYQKIKQRDPLKYTRIRISLVLLSLIKLQNGCGPVLSITIYLDCSLGWKVGPITMVWSLLAWLNCSGAQFKKVIIDNLTAYLQNENKSECC